VHRSGDKMRKNQERKANKEEAKEIKPKREK
jgi:hypothetical protein